MSAAQRPPLTFRPAHASMMARHAAGFPARRAGATDWHRATAPATAGEEKLVPDMVRPTAEMFSPGPARSGSSLSECGEIGFLKFDQSGMRASLMSCRNMDAWAPTGMAL